MDNANKNCKSSSSTQVEDIKAKLTTFQSMIFHALEIEEDIRVIVDSLKERSIDPKVYPVDISLAVNLKHLREILDNDSDFHFREFLIHSFNRKAAVVFLAGMSNIDLIHTHIIAKLMLPPLTSLVDSPQQDEIIAYLKNTLLTAISFSQFASMEQAIQQLLSGYTLLFIDGLTSILVVESRKMESRAIAEPETEATVRGPRDSFVEGLQINISLIRRRLKNPNLIVKKFTIGVRSNTDIAIIYFRGIANLRLVDEVERRLKNIKIDAPSGLGVVEGLIEDHPYSPFPTMLPTERPDKFAAALMEGKVGIMMDGDPYCLLAPVTINDFLQTSDDYNEKWQVASVIRFTRYFSFLFAVITPAVFIAITTFHPGLLPTPLAITIAIARLGIPFPAFLEALIMESLLEILQEAGLRLPKPIGPAISIVGGLVIGEATVRAGLVSAPMVIVIAFTAIVSFNIANYRLNLVVRLLRIPFLVLAASFGMFGVMIGLLTLVAHLSFVESFGIPYLAPLTPKNSPALRDLQDTAMITPASLMKQRPAYLAPQDVNRQKQ